MAGPGGEVVAMFGMVAPGRIVSTQFARIDQTHFLINLEDIESINHIVIFMTGSEPFPVGYAGGVYLSAPSEGSNDGSWQYLGYISNEKPSAIFRLLKHKISQDERSVPSGFVNLHSHTVAQIGVSVETESVIQQQTAATGADPVTEGTTYVQKLLENFVNYVSSFAQSATKTDGTCDNFVPLSVVQKWYENFNRRLQLDPYFWKRSIA